MGKKKLKKKTYQFKKKKLVRYYLTQTRMAMIRNIDNNVLLRM